jgi:hypothetical protein
MNSTDRLLKSLPHVRSLFGDDDVQKMNNRYPVFDSSSFSKDNKVQRLSITNKFDYELENTSGGASRITNMYYHQLMYNTSSDDKQRRLNDFRIMSNYSEVERALTEIVNEFFENDDKGHFLKIQLNNDHNSEVQSLIEDEFYKFIEIYKFQEKGNKYIREWLVEGELFFENIISLKKPELGIIGVTKIASDRCDPLYYDLDNELIDCFLLRAKAPDMYPFQWGKFTAQNAGATRNQHQLLFMNEKQITYIANDQWSDGRKHKIPVLAYAQRPYRQLSLIEDATVIYMIVRAPERLMFNIDVAGMKPSAADQYMRKTIGQFWSKKTLAGDGRIENTYDPQGMLENYWFPMREGSKGSSVSSIGGGKASPDNLEILTFFVQKLYQSLKVPLSRLNSETAFNDSASITREELCFSEYIINLQKLWAGAIKRAFIVHLKLKGKKLLETARQLNIETIPSKDNKPENAFQVSQIYKDSFSAKCWDNYDLVAEEVNKVLDGIEQDVFEQRESLVYEMNKITDVLNDLKDNVIFETEDINTNLLTEQLDVLEEEYTIIEGQENKLSELRSDMLSWWEQYDIKEEDIHIKFVEPSQFFALREQQLFQIKYDNFNNMSQNDFVSNTLAQKMYLGWSDREVLANLDMLKKDAAFRWEIQQIEQNGPKFREKAIAELEGAMAAGGMGGFGGGGGGGPALPGASEAGGGAEGAEAGGGGSAPSDTALPAFGPPVEAGGGAEGESEEAPAPEA